MATNSTPVTAPENPSLGNPFDLFRLLVAAVVAALKAPSQVVAKEAPEIVELHAKLSEIHNDGADTDAPAVSGQPITYKEHVYIDKVLNALSNVSPITIPERPPVTVDAPLPSDEKPAGFPFTNALAVPEKIDESEAVGALYDKPIDKLAEQFPSTAYIGGGETLLTATGPHSEKDHETNADPAPLIESQAIDQYMAGRHPEIPKRDDAVSDSRVAPSNFSSPVDNTIHAPIEPPADEVKQSHANPSFLRPIRGHLVLLGMSEQSAYLRTICEDLYAKPVFTELQDCLDQGMAAGEQCYKRDQNPYCVGTARREWWDSG